MRPRITFSGDYEEGWDDGLRRVRHRLEAMFLAGTYSDILAGDRVKQWALNIVDDEIGIEDEG